MVLRTAAEGIARDAVGTDCDESVPAFARGDLGLVGPVPFATGLRKGEAVLVIAGGVWVLEGGLLGLFMAGLSHEEKKSSFSVGVAVPPIVGTAATMSVMTTSSGYLNRSQPRLKSGRNWSYSSTSAAARLLSSSLYFEAALEVYLVLGSFEASAAVPPCDWKYLVADSLPPTFMVRN